MSRTRLMFLLFVIAAVSLAAPTFTAPAAASAGSPPQAKKAPDVSTLKGGPLGSIKFDHKKHSETLKIACETCHHASKPQKPATEPNLACSNCHVTPQKPPMKTNKMLAFHNLKGDAGTCMDCHKLEKPKGKAAPITCMECHKKG